MGDTSKQKSWAYMHQGKEIDVSFRLYNIGDFTCDETYYTERDGDKKFLMFATIEGKGILEYNNISVYLTPGTLAVINSEKYQLYKTAPNNIWHFLWLNFESECAESIENFINQDGIFLCDNSEFIRLYEHIKILTNRIFIGTDIEISLDIHRIISDMAKLKSEQLNITNKNKIDSINEIIQYIGEHYCEDINIDSLSERSNLSKYYLIRIFKEFTGITPYKYIVLMRITHAKRLLLTTEMTISEISAKTGFNDSNNFIVNFKSITGKTPTKFRENSIL